MASQDRVYQDLADRYGVRVAEAFLAAMQDLRTRADVRAVIEALERRDYESALRALNIEEAAFADLLAAIRQGYNDGGKVAGDFMPARRPDGSALVVRFDPGNPQAEAEAREHAARLVRRITEEARQVVRQEISQSLNQGLNPRQIAPNIVGRVNRATGQREGGVIGLTEPQAQAVRRAREELASGEPGRLRAYLERGRRDRRYDRTVAKAIREETEIPAEKQRAMILAYERKLLALRAEVLSRTEALTAIQMGAFQSYEQIIASGKLREDQIVKRWSSSRDFRVRHSHRVLDGQRVSFRQPFTSITGARLMHPMDTSLGAGADDIVGCRCIATYSVDWLAGIK